MQIVMVGSRVALGVAVVVATIFTPGWWCGRDGDALFAGDATVQDALGTGVDGWMGRHLSGHAYGTGSERFDGEWLFGTQLMAALGYAHVALERPAERARLLPRMEAALDRALDARARAFDHAAWGSDPIADLGSDRAHAAYLGYLNLALSLHRYLDPDSRFADTNDAITAHLARRLSVSEIGLVETYPGEVYPVDNAAFIGSLGPYDAATGADHGDLVAAFVARLRERYVDRDTGLLIQAVDATTGAMCDEARGSGTALAAYFLSFSDRRASHELWDAMRAHLLRDAAGLAAMREYPVGVRGSGDIDSGPLALGLGVSATGFALGVSRAHGDAEVFRHLWASTVLVGAPTDTDSGRRFVMGGAIGDTLLFAMLTTPRGLPWEA